MDVPLVHSTCSPFQDQYETCIQMGRCMLYEGGETATWYIIRERELERNKTLHDPTKWIAISISFRYKKKKKTTSFIQNENLSPFSKIFFKVVLQKCLHVAVQVFKEVSYNNKYVNVNETIH